MNLTKHFKQRYVERIVGITTPTERGQYIVANESQIQEHINKLYEHAQFIWRGQLSDNITRNYYIRDDIIIVTDTDNSCFITLFKCDLGFPTAVNRQTIKGLMKEIDKLNTQLEKSEEKAKSTVERLQTQVSTIDEQMAALQSQIELLRHKRNTVNAEIKDATNDTRYVQEELHKLCVTLCNSVDYRTDLVEWKKNA